MPDKTGRIAAFFDVDGTLTSERTWKGIIGYFQTYNLRRTTHAVFLGLHYPLYFLRRMGLLSESRFRATWASHLAWYVRGYTLSEANKVWTWGIENFLSQHWREDTCTLLRQHQIKNDLVMLVSSAPQPFLEAIANHLGVQHCVGTRLESNDQVYTGRSLRPVCIDAYKAILVREYLNNLGIKVDLHRSYAYADSIADLALLEMVGNPIAVYPDRLLTQTARQRGWAIFPEVEHAS